MDAVEVKTDTIYDFADSIILLKVKKKADIFKIKVDGIYTKVIFNPSSCNTPNHPLKIIDSTGLIPLNEQLINSGQCYCNSCLNAQSWQGFQNDSVIFIEVYHPKSIKIISQKDPSKIELWHQKKLKKGDIINLENILFVGGEAKFLKSSYKDLDLLVATLTKNTNLHILIMGHVNAPNKPNTNKNIKLSNERAKAVMDYLITKGIDASRLEAKGYGNSRMIYPNAQTDAQMKLNRRVEILITEN